MQVITHVPALAEIITGAGSGVRNLRANSVPAGEDAAVLEVAAGLESVASKRARDTEDENPEETDRIEELSAIEVEEEKLRRMKLAKPEVNMEVDEEGPNGVGAPQQLAIHDTN